MIFNEVKWFIPFSVALIFFFACNQKSELSTRESGLIGIYFSEPDLTSIKGISKIVTLNQKWDETIDYEGDTSGEWEGYIIGPSTGEIKIHINSNRVLQVQINSNDTLSIHNENSGKQFAVQMVKGNSYPIRITFYNPGKNVEAGWFNIEWSWDKKKQSPIPTSSLYFTKKESKKLAFLEKVEASNIDEGQFIYAKVENTVVYYEPGRFAAWPANGGIWNWGDEIVLTYTRAYHKENKYHHSINRKKPISSAISRSMDGGKTWVLEDSTYFNNWNNKATVNKNKIDYSSKGFALRNNNNTFYYSYDKAKNWKGPFQYPDFGFTQLTSRTDYNVLSKNEALIFISGKDENVQGPLQDKAITIKTSDGGLNFELVSFMSERDSIRSVMPATIRIEANHLVTALRRRLDPPKKEKYRLPKNWIDVYESHNNGKSWNFLHKIADTDTGLRNGNPPSMVKLHNDVLCVVYGYRGFPSGIRAKISKDMGKTWSKEIILRNDAVTWDIGYSRSIVREDGKVVSVYYYATKERPERHIAATIWDPNEIIIK